MRNARVSMRTVQNNCFYLEFSVKNILESSHLGSNYINYTACNSHFCGEKDAYSVHNHLFQLNTCQNLEYAFFLIIYPVKKA